MLAYRSGVSKIDRKCQVSELGVQKMVRRVAFPSPRG
jgi:hypothetical protein